MIRKLIVSGYFRMEPVSFTFLFLRIVKYVLNLVIVTNKCLEDCSSLMNLWEGTCIFVICRYIPLFKPFRAIILVQH